MPLRGARKYTLSERVRLRLQGLFKPRGTAAMVAAYTQKSPVSAKRLSAVQLSMMLSGERRVPLDSLEDLAAALNVKVADLLGLPDDGRLSPEEERLLLAFRALDPSSRDHVLAVVELGSVATRVGAETSPARVPFRRGAAAADPTHSRRTS